VSDDKPITWVNWAALILFAVVFVVVLLKDWR